MQRVRYQIYARFNKAGPFWLRFESYESREEALLAIAVLKRESPETWEKVELSIRCVRN